MPKRSVKSELTFDGYTARFGEPWNRGEKGSIQVYRDGRGLVITWPFNADTLTLDARARAQFFQALKLLFPRDIEKLIHTHDDTPRTEPRTRKD